MAEIHLTLPGYRCERCGHEWQKRGAGTIKTCPKCRTPYWNTPRKPPKASVSDKSVESDR